MGDNNHFLHFGPDPFLPFLTNYEEQFQQADQDPWANAHFGFNGTQDLSIFSNSNFVNPIEGFRPLASESVPVPYSNVTSTTSQPPGTIANTSAPNSKESSVPVLDSTSSDSPAPAKRSHKEPKKTDSLKSDPSDKESFLLDKRARNLVASAKFRQKKKRREQELEKTAKKMTEKAQALEKKVEELEGQIKLLRGLLLDKTSR